MSDVDEPTDEELSDIIARATPVVVYAKVSDRSGPKGRVIETTRGSHPATPEGLRELKRDLVGGPGGPPSGTGRTFLEVVQAIRGLDGDPTMERVAEELNLTPRQVSRICQPHGGYRRARSQAGRGH